MSTLSILEALAKSTNLMEQVVPIFINAGRMGKVRILEEQILSNKEIISMSNFAEEIQMARGNWFYNGKFNIEMPQTPKEWSDWIWHPSCRYEWSQIVEMIRKQAVDQYVRAISP